MLSASDRSTACVTRLGCSVRGSTSAGTLRFIGESSWPGTSMPRPLATRPASPLSTWFRRKSMRLRTAGSSTLPSSKRSARTMWNCSTSVWLR